jgi:anti-sigma regulatory factor (Ser/Thr protein kinase)
MATQMQMPVKLEMTSLAAKTLVGSARTLMEFRLADWGLLGVREGALVDDACLVMAELVANAVKATPDGQITIRAVLDAAGVLISVWDSSTQMPEPREIKELSLEDLDLSPENFDDNGGNGLALIAALAFETCVIATESPPGKWVCARFKV